MQPKRKPIPANPDGELSSPVEAPQTGKSLPDYNLTKSKSHSRFRPRFPEYHFSVALPITRAIDTLHDQVDAFNAGLPVDILYCETTMLDSDRARFALTTRDSHKTGVRLTGTMQRWEGDRTRIDIDVSLQSANQLGWRYSPMNMSGSSLALLLFIGTMLVFFNALAALGFWINGVNLQVILIGIVIISLAFPLQARRRAQSPATQEQYTAQRDADSLTDILVQAFAQYDVQWIRQKQP